MTKIALINPTPDFTDIYGKLSEEASVLPPLGLGYLAGVLRQKKLAQVKIIDAQAEKITNHQTTNRILRWQADIVGLTATTDMIFLAAQIADEIKNKSPQTKVIIGGPHVSAVPKKTLKMFPSFDIAVIGEGEETILKLVKALKQQRGLKKIKGLVYRSRSKLVKTPRRPFIKDLDKLPFPAWNLFPSLTKKYRPAVTNFLKLPSTSVVTSRGCPGQCAFCDTRVFGCRFRVHSPEYVLKMISHLKRYYGIKDVVFYDDQLTIFRKRLFAICDGLKEMNLNWSCQARVNAVDLEMMKKMKESGCWKISFGVESASSKILKLMNKNITPQQAKKAINQAKKAGLEVLGYFILGFFGETKKSLTATKKFILKSQLDQIMLTFFLPFPGSPAYPLVKKYGEFHEDWQNLNAFDPDTPQFIPHGLSGKDLILAQKNIYRRFYFQPRIIAHWAKRTLTNPNQMVSLMHTAFNFSRFTLEK